MQFKAGFGEKADAAVLTLIGTVFLFLPGFTFYPGCGITERVLSVFSHANVFHLLCNLSCLWLIRFPKRVVTAFVLSVLLSYIPSWTWNLDGVSCLPTCGMSGLIIASIGMRWGEFGLFRKMLRYVGLPLLVCGLVPNVNTMFHFYCLFGGYVFKRYLCIRI